jgi:hypothetical protein
MEMQQKGPLFSMFNRIGLCVSLKIIYLLLLPFCEIFGKSFKIHLI